MKVRGKFMMHKYAKDLNEILFLKKLDIMNDNNMQKIFSHYCIKKKKKTLTMCLYYTAAYVFEGSLVAQWYFLAIIRQKFTAYKISKPYVEIFTDVTK